MDSGHCYCGQLDPTQPAGSLQCSVCRKRFHHDCLDNPIMTCLHGDSFFIFKCRNCGQDNREEHEHAKMSWVDAISLTLYNLQLGGGGKCGYYRWKEHICSFIDKNWTTLFGHVRKKTNTWSGTVAGTLSGHCPLIFLSGLAELGESGWWRLTEMKPPTYNVEPPAKVVRKKKTHGHAEMIHENYIMNNIIDRPRRPRSQPFSLTAAIELKARRIPDCNPTIKRRRSSLASKTDIDGSCSEHGNAATSTVEACVSEEDSGESQADLTKAPLVAQAPESGDAAPTEQYVTVMVKIEPPDVDDVAECLYQPDVEGEADVVAASPSTGVTKIKEEVTDTEEAENDTVAHLLGVDVDSDESDMEIDPGSFSPLTNVGLSNELNQSTVIDDMMLYLNDGQEMVQSTSAQGRGTGNLSHQSSRSQLSVTSDSKAVTDPDSDLDCPSEGAEDGETSEEEEEEVEDSFEEETGDEEPMRVEEGQMRGEPLKRHQKRRREEEQLQKENLASNLRLMTPYDEKLILQQLNKIMHLDPISTGDKPLQPWEADRLKHKRNVLRRKLIVRRLKREKGLPIFDLDATLAAMSQSQLADQPESLGLGMPMNKRPQGWERTLDRFLLGLKKGGHESRHKEFRTRLVGFEDDQLQPITSPYTMRVLKPFIWRNQETMPMKVKLLQEIIAYPHRNDSAWQQPLPATLDYCYVRPQHIPAVNALCRSFFWPGIDLAECLQYPDFSCVVMYKKLVVAFAFLVPDVKHNEAYISFIFTHPEWRGAGIATFMLYHLIQTCMGKDVTLHVSATNPAMLLYSKFGFKAEELCLDFYDKYLPVESKECRHAFFMRLRR